MKLACVQSNVVFKDPDANAEKASADLAVLKKQGVDLVLFPEAFLTGYCFDSEEEARANSISIDSAAIQCLRNSTDKLDIMAVVGFAEEARGSGLWARGTGIEAGAGSKAGAESHNATTTQRNTTTALYNSAAIFEPGKEPVIYRKSHLPCLGLDNFVSEGQGPLAVLDTRLGRIGVLICFDLRFPEAARVMALNGAELLVLITNWPEGAEVTAEHVPIARAWENRIFVATCNRVGTENGFKFIGKSKIVHANGKVLAAAGDEEETIVAELDLPFANQKRIVTIPGRYEVEVFKARRPELYLDLTRDLEG